MNCGHTMEDLEKTFMQVKCISCCQEAAIQLYQVKIRLLALQRAGSQVVMVEDLLRMMPDHPPPIEPLP